MVIRFEIGDWVKFRRTVGSPTYGWQGAKHGSVGFVQRVLDNDNLVVSFCSGMAHLLTNEVIKVIPLDRGQLVRLKPAVKEPRFDAIYMHIFIANGLSLSLSLVLDQKLE